MLEIWACLICKNSISNYQQILCVSCQSDLRNNFSTRHEMEFKSTPFQILSIGKYSGIWAQYLVNLKRRSRGHIRRAEKHFIRDLLRHYLPKEDFCDIDYFVSLPSHPGRSLFESDLALLVSELLSEEFSIQNKPILRVSWKWLFKQRPAQKFRSNFSQRWSVISEGKYLCHEAGQGENIFLIDDVLTTGASLCAAQKALIQNNYHVRGAFVLASAL